MRGGFDPCGEMQHLNFTLIDGNHCALHEPGLVEHGTDLPVAVMQAVNDFLEAHDGELTLRLRIEVANGGAEETRPQTAEFAWT